MGKLTGVALAATILLLAAGTATAGVIGPTYPPPGGVTWSQLQPAGTSLGDPGGVTWSYQGFDLSATDDLWWAPYQVGASLNGGGLEYMQFYARTGTTSVEWRGQTSIVINNGGYYTQYGVQTRFIANLLSGNPWDPAPSGAASAPPYVENVQGGFWVNLQIQGSISGGSWQPLDTLFNSYQTYPGHTSDTSMTAGFWYTENPVVPLPPAALTGLALLGALGGVGLLRRHRR